MDALWGVVVGALLAAGLGWWRDQQQWGRMREQRRDDLKEARRLEERDAMAELIDAGSAWLLQFETLVYGVAGLEDPTTVDRTTYSPARSRFSKALNIALLTVTENDLHDRIVRLREEFSRDDLVGPVIEARFAAKPAQAALDRAIAYVDNVRHELDAIETAAVDLITRTAADDPNTNTQAARIPPPRPEDLVTPMTRCRPQQNATGTSGASPRTRAGTPDGPPRPGQRRR